MNAGQVGLGSSRSESSRPGSSQPGHISVWSHIEPTFGMLVGMCLIIKGLFNKSWRKDV